MEQPQNKREIILQATLDLVMKHGLNELTTAKIARQSGTAETIIYRHFAGKHAILTELIQRMEKDFNQNTSAIVSEDISPLEKLEKMTAFHLEFIQRTHGMSRIAFSEQVHLAPESDPFKQAARTLAVDFRNCVKTIIAQGIQQKKFVPDLDVETASMSYMGLHYLLMHEWALDDFSWPITDYKGRIIEHFHKVWKAC